MDNSTFHLSESLSKRQFTGLSCKKFQVPTLSLYCVNMLHDKRT